MGSLTDATQKIISVVGKAAPLLASALGTPLAGVAVSLISNLFGADPKNADDILAKINADPEYDLKLKQLELAHKEEFEHITLSAYQAEIQDRMDARAKFAHDSLIHMLAYMMTIGLFAIIFGLFVWNGKISEANSHLLALVLGMMVAKFGTIIDFYYGSSSKLVFQQGDPSTDGFSKLTQTQTKGK